VLHATRTPAPPLDQYIASLWYCAGGTATHAKERVLPSGSIGLIVSVHEDSLRKYDRNDPQRVIHLPAAIVCGARTDYSVIDAVFPEVIGAQFRIGGAFPFFRLPLTEVSGSEVGICDVWGDREATRLRERLQEAATPEAKLAALECALLERLGAADRHPAVTFALREFGGRHARGVGEVTEEIGLSPRRFIEVFHRQVGLTPKVFCRLRRFQRVLRRVYAASSVDWVDVAIACGYFDQAHFIHDFRAFSGITPGAYFAQRTQFQNHVAL